jgi:hypothetical protein
MVEIQYIVVTSIIIVLISLITLIFGTIFEKMIKKINRYISIRRISKAVDLKDNFQLNEELIKLSIEKIKSKNIDKKRLGLAEIHYGWLSSQKTDKHKIIDELIRSLQDELDPEIKKEIIYILYKLTSEEL